MKTYKLIKTYPGRKILGIICNERGIIYNNVRNAGFDGSKRLSEREMPFLKDVTFWEEIIDANVVFDTYGKNYYHKQGNGKWRCHGQYNQANPIDTIEYTINNNEIGKVRYVIKTDKKAIEKDYEILSFKLHQHCISKLGEDGLYHTVPNDQIGKTEQEMLQGDYYIYSIKRLSDGEIFTVGDEIQTFEQANQFSRTITNISLNNCGIWLNVSNIGGCLLNSAHKYKKDYEILSFILSNIIFKKLENGNYGSRKGVTGSSLEMMLDNCKINTGIHSIKRLSDNQIFTLDDKIQMHWQSKKGYIESIYYNEHKQLSFKIKGSEAPLTSVFNNNYPIKLVEPLFTTKDGVDIFEGDEFFRVWDIKGELKQIIINALQINNTMLILC